MMRFLVTILALQLALTACAVGPRYKTPPVVPVAPAWTEPASTESVDLNWWRKLGDPIIDELVQAAIAHNLDVRVAEAQIKEARANQDATAGSRLPQINATGSVTRNEVSANGEIPISKIPGFSRKFNLFDAGFDASWELDFWGRIARSVEEADARTAAAVEARRNIQLEVVAEVVRTYADLRSAQGRLAAASEDADAQFQTAALVAQQFGAGEASRLDSVRAAAQARSTHSKLPSLKSTASAAAYSLALLTGRPPEALMGLIDQPAPLPETPPSVGAGLRSDLLRRRPDILQAERQLAAATADIGVQTAELFPRVTLGVSGGQQAQRTGDLFSGSSTHYQVGPSLSWPIFAGGRIRAQIRAANARTEEAGARYEKAVLTAFADSETALNRYASASAESKDLEVARDQMEQAVLLALQRYHAGEVDLTSLLDAQSQYSAAQQNALAARASELTALASLYKALGGGWDGS